MAAGMGSTMAALGLLAIAADTPGLPLQLDVATAGDRLTLTVVGAATEPVEARYTLDVVTGTGGNRSTHSGTAHLASSERRTLSTVTVAIHSGQPWAATLNVVPSGAVAYSVSRSSD